MALTEDSIQNQIEFLSDQENFLILEIIEIQQELQKRLGIIKQDETSTISSIKEEGVRKKRPAVDTEERNLEKKICYGDNNGDSFPHKNGREANDSAKLIQLLTFKMEKLNLKE